MTCHAQRAKILLVEDTEDDAFFFRHALDQTGLPYEITHLLDGGEAIDYLTAFTLGNKADAMPDLIFLDLKLPKYSGFEILSWMNDQNFQRAPRVTILSGSDHPSDISTARELGVSDYVVKPISAEELKRRILSLSPREPEESERLMKRS